MNRYPQKHKCNFKKKYELHLVMYINIVVI
jgi:hypothetical protein